MEASPVNIIRYFDGSKQGVIPLFQRPYSWGARDWNTLWEDLIAQYEEEDRSSHFMGAIVTVPVRSVPVGVTKHLVIDGQQRLTTLSILLTAIRHKAREASDTATEGIIGDLLVNRHYNAPDDLKLVPTQADRAAYNALVHKQSLEDHEESRVVQAYRHFLRKLDGSDADDRPLIPAQVLQAIQQSLQVVMINLGESDDPYLIFESLNHKGKPLNQADLVRNYVLMRFQHSTLPGGEQETIYEEIWHPMEAGLSEAMTEFLRHYAMRHGRNVRKGDIYTGAKAEFQKEKEASDVRERLVDMKEAALAYEKFLRPDEEENPDLAKGFRAMQELDSTVFYPLLIRLYRGLQNELYTSEEIGVCLQILESYYVRRLICGVPTNGLNKVTMELCLHLTDSNPAEWLGERLAAGAGGRRWPTDEEFGEAMLTASIYPRRRIARFILVALEEAFAHKEAVDAKNATIEHIMPQTLTATWKQELGADHLSVHGRWLDTLGNLTLTGYNSELGNDPFEVKKSRLQNTHFELSKSVLKADTWGADEIQARGQMLTAMAISRWGRADLIGQRSAESEAEPVEVE